MFSSKNVSSNTAFNYTWVSDEYSEVDPGNDDLPCDVLDAKLEVLADVPAEVRVTLLLLK